MPQLSNEQNMTNLIMVTKAQLWEEAVGKLRAMVRVEGQCSAHAPEHRQHRDRYPAASTAIEKFIKEFEDEGFHE